MSCSQANDSADHLLPAYTAEPRRGFEQTILVHEIPIEPLSVPNLPGQWCDQFVKQSKSGGVTLKVSNQRSHVPFPIYQGGTNNPIRGCVDLAKPENVASVELKECTISIQRSPHWIVMECHGGGEYTTKLCDQRVTLWTRDNLLADPSTRQGYQISLPFALNFPNAFSDEHGTYPLPPSFESSLSGLPGFHAAITYSLSVVVNKNKSSLFRLGNQTLSTPLIYLPRSRPPTSLPPPLHPANFTPRLDSRADWQAFAMTVKAKRPFKGAPPDLRDIESELYLHTTRVFPIVESIPFYLSFLSSSSTLAAFMPFGPQIPGLAGSSAPGGYQSTRIRLTRQVIVDAMNPILREQTASVVQREPGRNKASSLSGPVSSSSGVWDTTTIGEGNFKLFNHGPDWITFYGEIPISDEVRVSGFKTSGLLVRDFLSLTMVPSDPTKSPFKEFHQKVPVRLTTDPWA